MRTTNRAWVWKAWVWAVVLFVVPVSVLATEWIVAPGGDDANGEGTPAHPYRTVTRVLDTSNGVAKAGDTVTLRGPPGNNTYNECDVRLRLPLTLRSYPGERAHIHCDPKTAESVVVQVDAGASGSHISGLELSGSQYYGVKMNTDWYRGAGESGSGASNILLEDLKIHDTGRDGIKITPKSNHVTIRRCEIWNTGALDPPGTPLEKRNAEGIDNVNGSNMLVEDSYIHDIATTGLYFKGGARDVVVQRNRIENTGEAGILAGFDTSEEYFDPSVNPHYYESVGGIVRNNIVRNTGYAGIGLYAAKDAVIANNTIVDTARLGHAAIYFGITYQDWDARAGRPPSENPLIRNNLVIQDGGACVAIRWAGDLGGLSALKGAPNTDWNGYYNAAGPCSFVDRRPGSALAHGGTFAQWKNQEKSDLHSVLAAFTVEADGRLPAGSAALGKGVALKQVVDDIDGNKRVGAYDLGAQQVSATASPAGQD